MQPRAALLVGSPRGFSSTSASLASYLGARLQQCGWQEEQFHLTPATATPGGRADLLACVRDASLVVISSPLYLDAPPYPVILAMELLAEHRQSTGALPDQRLMVISNCGYPEAHQNETALAIYRRFAQEAGFAWAGGMALGAGQVIGGKPLEQLGGVAENIRQSLEMAAEALAEGRPVPRKAIALMAKPAMPRWLYLLMASRGWQMAGEEHGAGDLERRPYAESEPST